MPTAREALLNAALSALTDQSWSAVRMVDVASAAGVSRQTLYNEFGSKDGLARALVRREADLYLHGVERLLTEPADPVDRLVSVAEWTVAEARSRPLLRALLTDCWTDRHPAPRPVRPAAPPGGAPAQRRADAGAPAPADLVAAVRNRAVAALDPARPDRRSRTEAGGPPRTEPLRVQAGRVQRARVEQARADQARAEQARAERGRTPQHRRPERARPDQPESAELAFRCELAVRLALAHVVAPDGEPVGHLVRAAVAGPVTGVSAGTSPRAGGR
ncbi:TetR/AcrR family transcriptional regulator [Streptomyces sp. NPDC058665]|uniref:TetR/AcrR family transcriptional regulator n=1 Tax=Streptomyces sp. NPDC058665 TaxID=3346586 RepID=UPI0036485673